jgi:hypothetical protein
VTWKDLKETVSFLISDNIPEFAWENRKFTVAKIKEDHHFTSENNCTPSGLPRNLFQGDYARNFFGGGGGRTEGRENGDLEAVAP